MKESKFYQLLVREATVKATVDNTMLLLEHRFPGEAVDAVKTELLKIDDSQKLQQLVIAAAEVTSIEAFAQLLTKHYDI